MMRNIWKAIDFYKTKKAEIEQKIEGLVNTLADLSDGASKNHIRRLLTIFKDSIDEMSVEQKRTTVRTIIQKVVWNGENAHVILSGVRDDEMELPKTHWGDISKCKPIANST